MGIRERKRNKGTTDMTDTGNTSLSRDERTIQSAIGERGRFILGELGVTKIIAYDENGEMAHVPWLAIFKGETIAARCSARDMTISYEPADGGF